MNLDRLQEALFARVVSTVEFAIVTPLPSAYDSLRNQLRAGAEPLTGCYQNTLFSDRNGAGGLLVLVPQGKQAQDAIYAIPGRYVLFFGYAGGLTESVSPGTLLEVRVAKDEEGLSWPLACSNVFPQIDCGYSPCMLGELAKKHWANARLQGCTVVDMEIAACAQAAQRNDCRLTAWVMVTDIPERIEFWDLTPEHHRALSENLIAALSRVVSLTAAEMRTWVIG